jgi:hypothetical protein
MVDLRTAQEIIELDPEQFKAQVRRVLHLSPGVDEDCIRSELVKRGNQMLDWYETRLKAVADYHMAVRPRRVPHR